jgi:hypothetical protein
MVAKRGFWGWGRFVGPVLRCVDISHWGVGSRGELMKIAACQKVVRLVDWARLFAIVVCLTIVVCNDGRVISSLPMTLS